MWSYTSAPRIYAVVQLPPAADECSNLTRIISSIALSGGPRHHEDLVYFEPLLMCCRGRPKLRLASASQAWAWCAIQYVTIWSLCLQIGSHGWASPGGAGKADACSTHTFNNWRCDRIWNVPSRTSGNQPYPCCLLVRCVLSLTLLKLELR